MVRHTKNTNQDVSSIVDRTLRSLDLYHEGRRSLYRKFVRNDETRAVFRFSIGRIYMSHQYLTLALLIFAAHSGARGSTPDAAPAPRPTPPAIAGGEKGGDTVGIDDDISIRVADDDDFPDKPFRIDSSGFVHLPLIGSVEAAGLTTARLETVIASKLRSFITEPHVTVTLALSQSRPVSVLGAVNSPGVHQIVGPNHLLEALSLAGGLRPDAGSTARLTRDMKYGEIPLPNARVDLSGKFSVADIDIDSLMRGKNPEQNILICPQDVIAITKADLVYVIGQVKKAGGFPIQAHERISILTAVALAEGMEPNAAPKNARILRESVDGPERKDIPVNLSRIMQGQAPDVALLPNDIVVVPNNTGRAVAIKSAEIAVALGTGLIIWRH